MIFIFILQVTVILKQVLILSYCLEFVKFLACFMPLSLTDNRIPPIAENAMLSPLLYPDVHLPRHVIALAWLHCFAFHIFSAATSSISSWVEWQIAALSVKNTDAQHLSAPTHMRSALFALLLHLSYTKEVNKKKLSNATALKKRTHHHLVFGGKITLLHKQA